MGLLMVILGGQVSSGSKLVVELVVGVDLKVKVLLLLMQLTLLEVLFELVLVPPLVLLVVLLVLVLHLLQTLVLLRYVFELLLIVRERARRDFFLVLVLVVIVEFLLRRVESVIDFIAKLTLRKQRATI